MTCSINEEIMKMKIRSNTIIYSTKRKQEMSKLEENLENEILILEEVSNTLTKTDSQTLQDKKVRTSKYTK